MTEYVVPVALEMMTAAGEAYPPATTYSGAWVGSAPYLDGDDSSYGQMLAPPGTFNHSVGTVLDAYTRSGITAARVDWRFWADNVLHGGVHNIFWGMYEGYGVSGSWGGGGNVSGAAVTVGGWATYSDLITDDNVGGPQGPGLAGLLAVLATGDLRMYFRQDGDSATYRLAWCRLVLIGDSILRHYPRDDGRGVSAPRKFGGITAQQGSGRKHGGYR